MHTASTHGQRYAGFIRLQPADNRQNSAGETAGALLWHFWLQVIKLTLIYGVLGLEQQFSGANLSIPQLRQLVEKGGAQLVVERNLPGLQRQILNLQTNLDAVFDRLAVEVRGFTKMQ